MTESETEEKEFNYDTATDKERLLELEKLIIGRKLEGRMPNGFLAIFYRLPDELTLSIWGYLSRLERLAMRAVCKHWLNLWKMSHKNKVIVYSLTMQKYNVGNKYRVCFKHGLMDKCFSCPMDSESINRILSLIHLREKRGNEFSNALTIGSGVARPEILQLVAAQNWNPAYVIFNGKHKRVETKTICDFLSSFAANGTKINIIFQNAYFDPLFDINSFINTCEPFASRFTIVDDGAKKNLLVTSRSLGPLGRVACSIFVRCSQAMSLRGIRRYVEAFFNSRKKDGEKTTVILYTTPSRRLSLAALARFPIQFENGKRIMMATDPSSKVGEIVYLANGHALHVQILPVSAFLSCIEVSKVSCQGFTSLYTKCLDEAVKSIRGFQEQ